MVDWTITATTIYCDATDDEVTVMVFKDGSTKCTGYDKYSKSDRPLKQIKCLGTNCSRLAQYKDKLFSEESGK